MIHSCTSQKSRNNILEMKIAAILAIVLVFLHATSVQAIPRRNRNSVKYICLFRGKEYLIDFEMVRKFNSQIPCRTIQVSYGRVRQFIM